MTKLEELEAAWWDAYWAARDARGAACYPAYAAWDAAYTAYKAELKKIKQENSNDGQYPC